MDLVVDANVLFSAAVVLDIDRGGVQERVAKLDDEGRHAISAVTVTELRLGVNRRNEPGRTERELLLIDG